MILDQLAHVRQPDSSGFSTRTQRTGVGKSLDWSLAEANLMAGKSTISQIHPAISFGLVPNSR